MELTPRTGPDAGTGADGAGTPPASRRSTRSRLPAIVLIVVVVLGLGFVLVKALGSATTFYRNVDEAVAERESLGTKRFRLQGTVVDGTIERTGEGVDFVITFNGVELPVQHTGDPPEMFKPDEAVLLEGHFVEGSDVYRSDLMIVKHSEVYEAENEDRLKEAEEGGHVQSSTSAGEATEP